MELASGFNYRSFQEIPKAMRHLAVIVVLLTLGGCALLPPVALVEGATAVGTGKPLSDHIVSYSSGKNCSTVRSNSGRSYCEEEEANPSPRVWCYRTLGNVTCYDKPDPLAGKQRRVGDNDHNTDLGQ